jgi:hypothetical protein
VTVSDRGSRRWARRLRHVPRLRGPWYAEVLAGIAQSYPQCCYVEIGIEDGVSLAVVSRVSAEVHACDILDRRHAVPRGVRFWHMPSDEFFSRYDGPPPNLVFIDGSHEYEQARRDWEHAKELLAPGGIIALHDTCPRTEEEKAPERCGDVWRLEAEITEPKLTLPAFPGLTLVRL